MFQQLSMHVVVGLVLGSTIAAARSPQVPFVSTSSSPECIHDATAASINDLLRYQGPGASVILCENAHVVVEPHGEPITFTAPGQSIYTIGHPEDHTRATISIESERGLRAGDLTTVIKADCSTCRGIKISSLHIDGARDLLGAVEGGDAMILLGGDAGEQELRHVDAWGARGYAIVHASEGKKATCSGVTVAENTLFNSGSSPLDLQVGSELLRLRQGAPAYKGIERPGVWTDGISIACARSTVTGNTVRDVTGIGIALRGGPATQVVQNTIVARDRDMLAGIAIVSHPAFRSRVSNDDGIVVRENRVHAASAMIRIGISTGAGAWTTDELVGDHEIVFGSEISKNRISSYTGYLGYAIAISDARGIIVQKNAVSASIWGLETSACFQRPAFVPPTPLLRDPRSVIGKIQSEFTSQHYGFLACVGPGLPSSSGTLSRHQINDDFLLQHGHGRKKGGAGRAAPGSARGAIPAAELHPHRDGQKDERVRVRGAAAMKALQRKKNSKRERPEQLLVKPNESATAAGVAQWEAREQAAKGIKKKHLRAPRRQASGGRIL